MGIMGLRLRPFARGAARKMLVCLSLTLLVGMPLPALAKDRSEAMNFVLGNLEFVLLHEFAHVVIGDNDVPILGPLESAADYTALVMAIRGDGSQSAKAFLSQAIRDSASAFATTWRLAEANNAVIPYWDVHALSIQRYYSALCLIYGSDPRAMSDLSKDLPYGRAAGCTVEFQQADRGFQWLLDTYSGSRQHEIKIKYGRVASDMQRQVLSEIRRLNLLENTTQALNDLFRLKAPLQVTLRVCGRPEAAWQPNNRELLICYELLDAFARVYQLRDLSRNSLR